MNESEKIIKSLPPGVDAALITSTENRRYLSSFNSHTGYFLITKGSAYCIVDFRYYEAALNKLRDVNVVLFKDIKPILKELVIKHNIKQISLEKNDLTVKKAEDFSFLFSSLGIDTILDGNLDLIISKMRRVKSFEEIEKIKNSQKITEDAFNHVLKTIKTGVTEREIALNLEFYMRKNGANAAAFDFIVVSGNKTSMPHGEPSNKEIRDGELITIDIGAVFEGYHSDMTRTIALKNVGGEEKNIYDIVLKAQLKGISALKPGVIASDVDKSVRDLIKSYGFDEYFGHSTGHGVGLNIHENPRLSTTDQTTLEPGMVVTIEPGVYLPGKFGVRIEDMLVVTKDGYKNLTNIPKELILV